MVAVIALFQGELFKTYLGRLQQIPNSIINPEGTILLRLVLWKVSWLAFLEHPITGIGLGNFSVIEDFVMAAKSHPLWYYVHGATAHNVIMHYLAETGILGVSALLFLSWRGLSFARVSMRRAANQSIATTHGAIYAMMFVFFSTLFFMRAWTWEQGAYVFALLFALTAVAHANSKKTDSQTDQVS
jgi:O-antigen ligase